MAQRLRPGHNVFRSHVAVLGHRSDRDVGDVTRIDWSSRNLKIRPTHDTTGANLRPPPYRGIGGEHSRPQECPLKSRALDQTLDLCTEIPSGIRLLEQRVWSFQWR